MISSGEAESRAVAVAVKGAVGQVCLDAGVNITGLLVDIGSADDVDCRQHFMCWHLTRVLRPSLTEKVPPAMVRSVVSEEAPPRIAPLNRESRSVGLPSAAPTLMQLHRETTDWPELDGGRVASGNAGPWLQDRRRPATAGAVRYVGACTSAAGHPA